MKTRKPYKLKNDRSENTKHLIIMVTPALFKKVKIVSATKGVTMSEYLRALIEKDIENNLKGE